MASGLEIGATLGGYKILARLRAGAMGVLYLARRIGPAGFMRPVAIKVIHDHLAQNKRFVHMFIEEAKLSARIDDPHVVRVEEFGETNGRWFLVMEYVHGVSLAQTLGVLRKHGGIPVPVAVAIAMQMTAGLHGAHEATDEEGAPLGIVHRDVSPHNVLISYKGHVRIIDFGIAKARQSTGNTLTGSLRGKLAYMPPEQARSAKHVDRRADLYAVGLVLWEMLAGKRMLDAPNDIALLNLIKNPPIIPPSAHGADVPPELDAVVLSCLSQDPDGRPANGNELQRKLAEAYPPALHVLPSDIAAVMTQVRTAAAQMKETGDDTDVYGEEVRKTRTIFGRSMHESVELANDALDSAPSSDRASRPSLGEIEGPPSVIVAAAIEDDEHGPGVTTRKMANPIARSEAAARTVKKTGDPLKATAPSLPRVAALPSTAAPPAPTPPFAVIVAVVALICSSILLVILIVRDHRRQKELERLVSSTTLTERSGVPPVSMPSTPVTTNPPAPDEAPPPTILTPPPTTKAPSHAPPPTAETKGTTLDRAREASLNGEAGEVRRLLETKVRSGRGMIEEAALLRAACKVQRDSSCVEDVDRKYPGLTDPSSPKHL